MSTAIDSQTPPTTTDRVAGADEMMQIEVTGGRRLEGRAELVGAKNAALPAIVAACLSERPTVLRNVPTELADVKVLSSLLRASGATVEVVDARTLRCHGAGWRGGRMNPAASRKMRHSLLLMGLSAYRRAPMVLPGTGGCDLGDRKHDMHAKLLADLGFEVEDEADFGIAGGPCDGEVEVEFYYPSFGATLNFLYAALGRAGQVSVLRNAAVNPEVVDVANLLIAMGGDIEWVGDRDLRVRGVERLEGVDYTIMGDRIYAATMIAATAITGGACDIVGVDAKYLESEIEVWRRCGIEIRPIDGGVHVSRPGALVAQDIRTRPFPGFHTDIQPLHGLMMCFAEGTARIEETILDNRFLYCEELNRMGASIEIAEGDFICVNGARGKVATIHGGRRLRGTRVRATDLRGAAALVLAGLVAEGTTTISNTYQLDRGYGDLVPLLRSLGATVSRGQG